MSLEIKISAEKATTALKSVETAANQLNTALNKLAANTGLDNIITKLANFRGVNPQAITSVNQLSTALGNLGRVSGLTGVLNSLNNVNTSGIGAATKNVQNLGSALNSLRMPTGMTVMSSTLQTLGQNAQNAAQSVQSLGQATGQIKSVAPAAQSSARGLQQKSQAAQTATQSMFGLRGEISSVTGVLNGFGVALGGVGFAQFIKGAYEADKAVSGFRVAMKLVFDSAEQGEKALKMVDKAANDLALPLQTARKGFSQIATSMNTAGHSAEETEQVFRAFGTAFRVMNKDATEMARGFRAIDQIFTKGQIMAEETKQQLGEIIPAVQDFAKALGMSSDEFTKAMERGELSSKRMIQIAEFMQDKYGKALPEAMLTLNAAVTRVQNGFQQFLSGVGEGLATLGPALNQLGDALNSEAFIAFGKAAGTVIATVFTPFINGLTWIAQNIAITGPIIAGFATIIGGLLVLKIGAWIFGITRLLGPMAAAFTTVGKIVPAVGTGITTTFAPIIAIVTKVVAVLTAVGVAFGLINAPAQNAANGINKVGTAAGVTADTVTVLGHNLNNGAAAADTLNMAGQNTGSIFDGLRGLLTSAGQALGLIATESGTSAKGLDQVKTSGTDAGDSLETLNKRLANTSVESIHTGSSLSTAAQRSGQFSQGMQTVVEWSSNTISSLGAQIANLFSLAAAYDEAAAAAERLSKAGGGGAGGGGGGEYDSYAGGGIVGQSSRRETMAHSAFHPGVPKFALGGDTRGLPTVPGGGIPSILHPNEAVVPLAGGGSIPVEMSDAGGGDGQEAGTLGQILSVQLEIKGETTKVYEQVNALATIMSDGVTRTLDGLFAIHTTLISIDKNVARAGLGGGGTGGGGTGGGGGLGGGMALPDGFNTWSPQEQQKWIMKMANKSGLGFQGAANGGLGSLFFQDEDGTFKLRPRAGHRLGTPNASRDILHKFKDGSPNAYTDTYGGFTAMLHPDEAVIPLPDGRTVPVQLPAQMTERFRSNERMLDELVQESRRRRRSGTNTPESDTAVVRPIVVNMTVQAQDVGSFNRSKPQMIQQLQRELARTERNIGRERADDPTKR